jgi:hypothetical protein
MLAEGQHRVVHDHVGSVVGRGLEGRQHDARAPAHGLAEPQHVPQPVLARHRLPDLAHVELERDERHAVSGGQATEHGGRGQHGLVTARPQPDRQGDERLNVALRTDREKQRLHRPSNPQNAQAYRDRSHTNYHRK